MPSPFTLKRFLSLTTVALAACTTSGDLPPTDAGAAGDTGAVVIPPTATCTGDPTACLSGTFATKLFTAVPSASKIELFRTYPGSEAPIASQPVAMDGTFAFSGLSPWAHYYLRAVARFGSATSGTSITSVQGRLAVPIATPSPIPLTVIPAELEMLETTYKGGPRVLQWVSAHVFDPGTGGEITQATVSVSGMGLSSTAMPFATNSSGTQSFFASFSSPPSGVSGVTVQVTHPSFGASGQAFTIGQEASSFDEPAILTPQNDGTIPVGQALTVTWGADPPQADYAVMAFFEKKNGQFVGLYGTQAPLAADVTSDTVPAGDVPEAATYLVNVNVSQTTCGGSSSDGCSNLFHTAQATVTAQ